jgi:hypothetical protein
MTPNDLKSYGRESRIAPPLIDLCSGLVAVIVVLTAYSMVSDTPERQVVITTRAAIDKQIAEQRIAAAREAMEARECANNWRDLFRPEQKRGSL